MTHECTKLPTLSQGRLELGVIRATQIPQDKDTTLRVEPDKLVVARGGGCDPDQHPAPPKSPVRISSASEFVTISQLPVEIETKFQRLNLHFRGPAIERN